MQSLVRNLSEQGAGDDQMSPSSYTMVFSILQVACGSTSSFCTTNISGQLYAWGKLKVSGDNIM